MGAQLLWGVAVRHSTVGIAGAAAPFAGWLAWPRQEICMPTYSSLMQLSHQGITTVKDGPSRLERSGSRTGSRMVAA